MVKKSSKKRFNFKALIGVIFLALSIAAGVLLVLQPQLIDQKAVGFACPGAEQCPGTDGVLYSCHPGEGDGSPAGSICGWKGRVETCGPAFTKYCCPAAGGHWTTNMTACTVVTATPTPTPTPSPSPSPTPLANSCANNPWDVDKNGKVNIVDIGLIIDNYGLSPSIDPRTNVNCDDAVNVVDIQIVIDHYNL